MTKPRIVLRGEIVFATRRCSERRFFLRPDRDCYHAFRYCLAVMSTRYGIRLHEFIAMGNHYHLVFTDPDGRRPEFFRDFNSVLARALNARHGRWEQFFAPGSYNAVKLLGGEDIARKCEYTLLNPTEAALVSSPEQWEGACSWDLEYGQTVVVTRPDFFHRDSMPETAELTLWRPTTMYPELDDVTARAEVRRRCRERAEVVRQRVHADGGFFIGMRRVRRHPRDSSPQTRARRRGLRPTVAGQSRWARIEALQYQREFARKYRDARRAWESGERDVVFPPGTYLMAVRFGVSVANN